MAPLQTHELRIELTEDDRPEDRFSHHVNNARYFAFINHTFHGWYVKMGFRVPDAAFGAIMASTSYDFLRQVLVPGVVMCRIRVAKVGRTSMEHAVEMWDVSAEPVLAGRGRVVHVCIERALARAVPWPSAVLEKCFDGAAQAVAAAPADDTAAR